MKNTLILLALVFIMLCISFVSHAQAMARQMRKRLAATDTTDIYSRSPLRPFRYGYPYDKAQCLKNFGLLSDAADFHEGDTIAEVGAASGWIEGVLSVLCDSLTLFAEDIDTDYLNQDQFNHVKVYFDQLRASPQTNKLYYIIGTLTNTRLPNKTFDKIFLSNSFHEISKPSQILADISGKLKPGGLLIIADEFSSPYTNRRVEGCDTKVRTVEHLCQLAARAGLYLYDRKAPAYAKDNILIFSQDSLRPNRALKKIAETYDADLQMLEHQDRLNTDSILLLYTKILRQLPLIKATYPMLDQYLVEMSSNYEKNYRNGHQSAYAVAMLAIKIYPNYENVCEAYGTACVNMGYNNTALLYLEKAASLSDHPEHYTEEIKNIKDKIGN